MMKTLLCGLVVLSCLVADGSALALDVAGVVVPESLSSEFQGQALVLNGAGIRKRFFVRVYIGALYLPRRTNDVQSVLEMEGAKTVTLHFLHSRVSKDKIVRAWTDGFAANLSTDENKVLRARLEEFNGLFQTVHRGDRVRLDYIPGHGTQVWINEALRGSIAGQDFIKALLKVWLGPHPADSDLKDAMLGGPQ